MPYTRVKGSTTGNYYTEEETVDLMHSRKRKRGGGMEGGGEEEKQSIEGRNSITLRNKRTAEREEEEDTMYAVCLPSIL